MDGIADVRRGSQATQQQVGSIPPTLALLSTVHGRLGGTRGGRILLRALQTRRLCRYWLRSSVLKPQRDLAEDVTILIGVRDRADHRLALALRSIREQSYPAELLHTIVLDYGSKPEAARSTQALCRAHGAAYLRVESSSVWSRSRCLNVGVRRARTRFLLTSDTDILLSPRYIEAGVAALRRSPFAVICSAMLDLPKSCAEVLQRAAATGDPLPMERLRSLSEPRNGWASHPSITLTCSAFHQLIRGYDEFYELWGSEDIDLLRRLEMIGLEPRTMQDDGAYYLHQWHPKYENIPEAGREQVIKRNHDRRRRVHTIVRNDEDWGRGG